MNSRSGPKDDHLCVKMILSYGLPTIFHNLSLMNLDIVVILLEYVHDVFLHGSLKN